MAMGGGPPMEFEDDYIDDDAIASEVGSPMGGGGPPMDMGGGPPMELEDDGEEYYDSDAAFEDDDIEDDVIDTD